MFTKIARVLCMFLVAALLFHSSGVSMLVYAQNPPVPSSSSKVNKEELRKRLEELQQQQKEQRAIIDKCNEDIKNGKNIVSAAKARKAALEMERALIEEQITLKLQEITVKEQEIAKKAQEITDKQIEHDENDRLFRKRLLAIYRMNDASMLSTLLSVDSFSDFLSISKNLQSLSKHDTDLLTLLEAQRIALEAAKVELESLLATMQQEREDLNAKWEEYNRNIVQQEATISAAMQQIADSEAAKDAALAAVEEYQHQMEDIWKSLGSSSGSYVGGALEWPVPTHNGKQFISSWFGPRTLYGRYNFHNGVDVATMGGIPINGVDIVAANTGVVVMVVANSNVGYGNYLIVDHGGGIKTLYAHCSSIYVGVGTTVSRAQRIAAVGNTGNSTGPHLHFELRINNTQKVDPWPYMSNQKELN